MTFTLNNLHVEPISRSLLIFYALMHSDVDRDILDRFIGQLWFSELLEEHALTFWCDQMRACIEFDWLSDSTRQISESTCFMGSAEKLKPSIVARTRFVLGDAVLVMEQFLADTWLRFDVVDSSKLPFAPNKRNASNTQSFHKLTFCKLPVPNVPVSIRASEELQSLYELLLETLGLP
ncbi:hypothetical protein H9P43_009051 [Blastocladiella emersonii ATCC 22665]|nr:hypothetical protein H9P43_009051 [Blastocladiella emersonii ATCC 22665]